jgi:hypothetical protein
MPRRELHRVVRAGYNGGGDELGFVWEVLSANLPFRKADSSHGVTNQTHPQKQLQW